MPTPSRKSRWNRSSEASPPDPVAPPYITILFTSTPAAPWAALAEGGIPVAKYDGMVTFDFLPDPGGEVERVCVVSDGELAGCAGGASEETDLVLGVVCDAVAEAREGRVAKRLKLLNGRHHNLKLLIVNHLMVFIVHDLIRIHFGNRAAKYARAFRDPPPQT